MKLQRKHHFKHQAGFSLLEIIVVVVIISILFGLAISHLLKWRISAEKASINKLTAEMRDALKLQVTSFYAKGRLQDIITLVGTNPLNYAVELPQNYRGEHAKPNLQKLDSGHWIYDTTKKLLIYRVRYPDHFTTKLTGIKRIEFKVSLIYADNNHNNRFNRGTDRIEGLRLTSSENYSWQIK